MPEGGVSSPEGGPRIQLDIDGGGVTGHALPMMPSCVSESDVSTVIDRWVGIFLDHGISLSEILRIVPESFSLTLQDMDNPDQLKSNLSPALIDWALAEFNLDSEWFYGRSDVKYAHPRLVSSPFDFIWLCRDIFQRFKTFPTVYFVATERLDFKKDENQPIAIMFRIKALARGERKYHRFVPVMKTWDWGYERTRFDLKAIFRISEMISNSPSLYAGLKGTYGVLVPRQTLSEWVRGVEVPKALLSDVLHHDWYPGDYVETPERNCQAKDVEELDRVRTYCKERGYPFSHGEINALIEKWRSIDEM